MDTPSVTSLAENDASYLLEMYHETGLDDASLGALAPSPQKPSARARKGHQPGHPNSTHESKQKHHHHHHHHHRKKKDITPIPSPRALTHAEIKAANKEVKRLEWVQGYVAARMSKPTPPVIQNLLHKRATATVNALADPSTPTSPSSPVHKHAAAIGLPADTTATAASLNSRLRSRRAHTGIKCTSCGTIGYYRVNCPKCTAVTIDIIKDEWRPVTPEPVKVERERRVYDEDPQRMVEAMAFKKEARVATTTGMGNQSWFWRKDETVWMWDDEALPEQHVADKTGDGIDFTTASVGEVVRHFNQSDKKGVSGYNTLVPGKLKSVQDSDVKKEAVMKDVNTGALASALSNVLGGSYVSKDEVAADYEKTYAAPKKEKMRKNDKLANGTYLWDADTLHEGKGGEKRSGEGVKAQSRTRAEQNLHHVLHRLVAVVKTELGDLVPDFAKSMLQPPSAKLHKNYYPEEVFKEHKTYFKKQMVKQESAVHNHQFVGNYRLPDKLEYCFDRKVHKNADVARASHKKMHTEFEGRHMSLHGVYDWLSVLGKNDKYATTGRAAERAAMKLDKAFKDQKAWVESQEKHMVQRRERCVHLLTLFEEELLTDEKREIELMGLKGKQFGKRTRELVKERSETADRVMRIMMEYNFLPGVEIADYLSYTVALAKKCGAHKQTSGGSDVGEESEADHSMSKQIAAGGDSLTEGGDDDSWSSGSSNSDSFSSYSGGSADEDDSETEGGEKSAKAPGQGRRRSSAMGSWKNKSKRRSSVKGEEKKEEKEKKLVKTKKKKDDADKKFASKASHMNNGLAEYGSARPSKVTATAKKVVRMSKAAREKMSLVKKLSMDPSDPYVATYFPHLPSQKKVVQTKEAKKNFRAAGLGGGIRVGETEDSGVIPALLPLPDCYATGPVNQEAEKSYLAGKIMADLRTKQVDENGMVKREAVPLFHRISMDEGETYSDLVGRPFYYIDPRKQEIAKRNQGKMAKGH